MQILNEIDFRPLNMVRITLHEVEVFPPPTRVVCTGSLGYGVRGFGGLIDVFKSLGLC